MITIEQAHSLASGALASVCPDGTIELSVLSGAATREDLDDPVQMLGVELVYGPGTEFELTIKRMIVNGESLDANLFLGWLGGYVMCATDTIAALMAIEASDFLRMKLR